MRTILRMLFPVLVFSLALPMARAADYAEGIEYRQISPSVEKLTDKPREVVELFWYGCPHCYRFEPRLHEWLKNKPENVGFVRVPAVFVNPQTNQANPKWILHAKIFYTAELLGVRDKIHTPLFNRIHAEGKHMHSVEEAEDFFSKFGIDSETFQNTFNSFAVDSKLRRAIDLSRRYGATGVPTLIIDGKYRTDGPMSGGHEQMLGIVNQVLQIDSK